MALSTAILAVLAAIAGLLSGQHVNEVMMNQIEASDQWNYYQAKSIKASVLDAKMSLAGAPNESDAHAYAHAYSYTDSNCDSYGYCNGNTHSYCHSNRNSYAGTYAYTTAASYAATAPDPAPLIEVTSLPAVASTEAVE